MRVPTHSIQVAFIVRGETMREILFRGKTLTDKWVEGAYYKQEEFYGDKEDAHIIITSKETLDNDFALESCIVIPETLGQYTGLTDKNGTKIYEGDIVKADYDLDDIFYVDWEECNLEYSLINKKMSYSLCCVHKDDIEVIGNIHDTPELLEG